MDIDIAKTVGLVTREVKNRPHNGKPAKVVVASRVYDTSAEDLWDALTNAERIPRWFMPITGDLRLGGRYQLQGNAGGEVLVCEPARRLEVTWEMFGDVSWVEVRLSAKGKEKTLLELEHTAHIPDDDERWGQFGPGAVGVGWDLALMGLGLYLETGKPNDPSASEAWTLSPPGKDYIRRTSDDWGRASAAAGTPEADAVAAAERTRAFYTGEGQAAGEG